MFGRYAISQAPFAGQSGNFFALSLTENVNLADAYTATSTSSASITEAITVNNTDAQQDVFYFGNVDAVFAVADTNAVNSAFYFAQTEPVTLTDTQTVTAAFPATQSENITLDDSSTQTSTFGQAITEDFTLDDTPSYAGVLCLSLIHI